LSLYIPRSGGDANEVAIYQILGSLKSRRQLNLDLDTSDLPLVWTLVHPDAMESMAESDFRPPKDPAFDRFHADIFPYILEPYGRKVRKSNIRDGLINSAVGELSSVR